MRLYAWSVAIAGWGLLLPLLDVTPPPPTSLLAIFLLLAVVTEWLMVPLPRGGFQSAGLAVSSAALVIMGPVHTALVMSAGVVIGNGLLHRRPYLNAVFNSGQYILSILLAGAARRRHRADGAAAAHGVHFDALHYPRARTPRTRGRGAHRPGIDDPGSGAPLPHDVRACGPDRAGRGLLRGVV